VASDDQNAKDGNPSDANQITAVTEFLMNAANRKKDRRRAERS
jgi:hypothetical protein